MSIYELRQSGRVLCWGHCPNLGYPQQLLKRMQSAGIYLYCDGKRVKTQIQNGNFEGAQEIKTNHK